MSRSVCTNRSSIVLMSREKKPMACILLGRGISVGQGKATAPTQEQRPELRGSSVFHTTTCRTLGRQLFRAESACVRKRRKTFRILLLPPWRHLLALLARLGETDGDRLLAALHLAAAAAFPALGRAALVAAHFPFDLGPRTRGIFSATFLCHAVLLRRNDAGARSVFRACSRPGSSPLESPGGRSFGASGRSMKTSKTTKESCLAASTLTGRTPPPSSSLHGLLC